MVDQEMRKRYLRAALRIHATRDPSGWTDMELMESFLLIPPPAISMESFGSLLAVIENDGNDSGELDDAMKASANRAGISGLNAAMVSGQAPGVSIG